jgi:hypothetical protein
MLQAA